MIDIQSMASGLKLGKDGIWYGPEESQLSYPTEGHAQCYQIEDHSFWFKHRNRCIAAMVQTFPPGQNETIFDVGGGNGFVSVALSNLGYEMALMEPGRNGAFNAKQRGLETVICASLESAKFGRHTLPAVGLFDVLEHIDDDLSFLKTVKGLMKKQGLLFVTVPAYSFLWSDADVDAGHFRRYSLNDLTELLESAGFQIEFASYLFQYLLIPIYFFRVLPFKMKFHRKKRESKDMARDHAVINGRSANILDSIFRHEVRNLNRKKAMRFGASCIVVARSG